MTAIHRRIAASAAQGSPRPRLPALVLAACCAALAWPASVVASGFPDRPIKLIVGWPAGGPVDAVARIVSGKMSEHLGQSVTIDNRPGAGGNIGTEAAAQAKADGYTILFATPASHGLNSVLYAKLRYDPIGDFSPIGLITNARAVLVVSPNSPYASLPDLVQAARQAPGKLNYASAGTGSSLHLNTSLFNTRAGIDVTQVPYKGTAPALTDLMADRVDFMIAIGTVSMVQSGKLRALAVASEKRIPALPDVPTFEEGGIPFLTDTWYGLVAPAGTPEPALEKLNAALNHAIRSPEVRKQVVELGAIPIESTSKDGFWAFVKAYIPRAAEVVRISGAKPQ